ncbi:protein of unknown function (plasmid) [Paraburkholderia dioscoreae]|uniref:Uncharacterized protein n=1 Tax=Paraburkholderia dioscoreae TaxID=2604047 RepID=A0A5Q4Z993_9BURK|nr:protein of unknown function [Paraburkholderia dioscoreae]
MTAYEMRKLVRQGCWERQKGKYRVTAGDAPEYDRPESWRREVGTNRADWHLKDSRGKIHGYRF